MSTIKPTLLPASLAFSAPGKTVAFTPHMRNLLDDIIRVIAHHTEDASQQIATLLGTYLTGETPLISTFEWQQEQDYYDRFIVGGCEEHGITLMALIWPKNTFSPIHYHQAWCVFGVYCGALTETLYIPENNEIIPETTRIYPQGFSAYDSSEEKYYHKLGNVEEIPALSFHIYGVSPNNLHKINCMVGK